MKSSWLAGFLNPMGEGISAGMESGYCAASAIKEHFDNPSMACEAYRQSMENLKSYMRCQWGLAGGMAGTFKEMDEVLQIENTEYLQYNESGGIAMKHRILIIEDDVVIQTQLRNLLTGNGYEAETINDFPVAMEQVESFQPHLILLDIKLPENDGFSVCSQIRTFSNVPIIFVTSCNTDMD